MIVDNINRYGRYSRLRFYRIVHDEVEDTKRLGMRDNSIIEQAKLMSYSLYSIESRYEYRPDLISLEFYGTSKLWWIVSGVNNLDHPIKQMKISTELRIPDAGQLETLLMS